MPAWSDTLLDRPQDTGPKTLRASLTDQKEAGISYPKALRGGDRRSVATLFGKKAAAGNTAQVWSSDTGLPRYETLGPIEQPRALQAPAQVPAHQPMAAPSYTVHRPAAARAAEAARDAAHGSTITTDDFLSNLSQFNLKRARDTATRSSRFDDPSYAAYAASANQDARARNDLALRTSPVEILTFADYEPEKEEVLDHVRRLARMHRTTLHCKKPEPRATPAGAFTRSCAGAAAVVSFGCVRACGWVAACLLEHACVGTCACWEGVVESVFGGQTAMVPAACAANPVLCCGDPPQDGRRGCSCGTRTRRSACRASTA